MKRICVYCGSSTGHNSNFEKAARELGVEIGRRKLGLVYGGSSVGLMGTVADAVLDEGGEVQGVIPEKLKKREVAHHHLSELHVTENMHQRKALMAQLSDAFIALPGGFGTFEELIETITWIQLGIHHQPLVLFNVDGYYDPLINFVDQAVDQGFIKNSNREILRVAGTVAECFNQLELQIA